MPTFWSTIICLYTITYAIKYSYQIKITFKQTYLTHRLVSNRYYHFRPALTWEWWQWRGSTHFTELQEWHFTTTFSLVPYIEHQFWGCPTPLQSIQVAYTKHWWEVVDGKTGMLKMKERKKERKKEKKERDPKMKTTEHQKEIGKKNTFGIKVIQKIWAISNQERKCVWQNIIAV